MVLDSRRCQNVVKTLVPSVHLVCADACAETWNLSVKSSKIMIENMKCFITSCCSRLWQVWVPQGHPHHPLCWCCRNHTPCTSSREHEILLCFSIGKKKFHDIHIHSIFPYNHLEVMFTVSQQCDVVINCNIFLGKCVLIF